MTDHLELMGHPEAQAVAIVRREVRTMTARDMLRPIFRYRRWGMRVFVVAAALLVAAAVFWPKRYTAEMKLLVKHERIDPLVTGRPDSPGQQSMEVTETELNSEVELLKGRDLLESVADAAGLLSPAAANDSAQGRANARALNRLSRSLTVSPVRKTALIEVTYSAKDPDTAIRVLSTLSQLYLAKHLSVHRPVGAREFFTEQADRLRRELQDAEQRLVDFGRAHDVVSAGSQKEATLQRLATFEATVEDLRAQSADAARRIEALEEEIAATPQRQTTMLRTQDNGELIRDLRSRVLDLELRRTDLVRKFTDTYPDVVQVDKQLAQARAALEAAEHSPVKEETTDQNPTHQWLRNELSRVQAERQALQARAAAVEASVRDYRARARLLDEQSARQQDLERGVKAAEENYLLYQRKEEEARISDALDRTRIANVALAEAPTVPLSPSSRWPLAAGGVFAALVLSIALTFLLEFFNPRFRTRDEVWTVLALPVLAALPSHDGA